MTAETINNAAVEAASTPTYPKPVSESRRHYTQMSAEELAHVEARIQQLLGAYYDLGGTIKMSTHAKQRVAERISFHLGWSKLKGIMRYGQLLELQRIVFDDGHEDLRVIVRSRYRNCGGQNIFLAYSLTSHTLLTTWVQPPTFEWKMRKFWLYTMPVLLSSAPTS